MLNITWGLEQLEQLGLVAHKGGGSSSGGGGGSSGKVSWSSYLQDRHKKLIGAVDDLDGSTDAFHALNDVWDNSPYADASVYDPSDKLADAQSQLDSFISYMGDIETGLWDDYFSQAEAALNGAYNETTLYPAYYAQAVAAVNSAFGTTHVEALVTAQETRMVGPLMRSIARMSSGARDQNSVLSSTYVHQIAYMERSNTQDLADFAAKAAIEVDSQRLNAVTACVAQIIALNTQRVSGITGTIAHIIGLLQLRNTSEQVAAHYSAELNRVGIVAQKEFFDGDSELAVKDALWQLELTQYCANVLAAVQGASTSPQSASKDRSSTSMIGGAIGSAVTGGAAGADFGKSGVVTGALLGVGAALLQ